LVVRSKIDRSKGRPLACSHGDPEGKSKTSEYGQKRGNLEFEVLSQTM
jgi:hypothetical protein